MAMAATTAMICVCTYALAPLDLKPTPGHRGQTASRNCGPCRTIGSGCRVNHRSSPMAVMDKVVSAGAYGLLAFVLLLSAREAGRSLPRSAWYALSRSVVLAVAIEGVQLFTISHVADPRDLFSAWLCCLLGCLVGWQNRRSAHRTSTAAR